MYPADVSPKRRHLGSGHPITPSVTRSEPINDCCITTPGRRETIPATDDFRGGAQTVGRRA